MFFVAFFLQEFPLSQLCRISENARWGSPWQICYSSALRAHWEPRFAAKCCARLALQVHSNKDRMAFAPGFSCGLLFAGGSPGRNFAEFQKTRAEGLLPKFAIPRLYGHFGRRGLQQNVVQGWHFKYILISTWWHLRQSVFCGLPFAGVSLGRNFAEFQKTRDEGLLAKFAIAWLYGHFGSRSFQQNVLLCWQFKCIVISTWWY